MTTKSLLKKLASRYKDLPNFQSVDVSLKYNVIDKNSSISVNVLCYSEPFDETYRNYTARIDQKDSPLSIDKIFSELDTDILKKDKNSSKDLENLTTIS